MPLAFTVATAALDVVQTPPDGLELSVELVATQIALVPVTGEGSGLTVTVRVAGRQLPNVYDIVAVPAETPVTTPPDTVAIADALVDQTPPAAELENKVVDPSQTVCTPDNVPEPLPASAPTVCEVPAA